MAQTHRFGRRNHPAVDASVSHIYQVGDLVALDLRAGHFVKSECAFKVIALLPPLGRDFQYRIKGVGEPYERVVLEYQLAPMASPQGATADGFFKQPDKQTV